MKESQDIPLTEHQRHCLDHLRACEASGKGIAAYAAEHGKRKVNHSLSI